MVTEADWYNRQPEDCKPYIDIVIELFGPERLLIGSDWPVCTLAADYHSVIDLVKLSIRELPEQSQLDILGRNCIRLYNLRIY